MVAALQLHCSRPGLLWPKITELQNAEWPSLSLAQPRGGWSIFRALFAKDGWQSDRTMGLAFTPARARNGILPLGRDSCRINGQVDRYNYGSDLTRTQSA